MRWIALAAIWLFSSTLVQAESSPENQYLINNKKDQITLSDLEAFIGKNYRNNFDLIDESVMDTFIDLSADRSNQPHFSLQHGYTLYQGCKYRDCDEKSALILDDQGHLKAAVLYHLNWLPTEETVGMKRCARIHGDKFRACTGPDLKSRSRFTLFISYSELHSFVFDAIKKWAIHMDKYAAIQIIIVPIR